MSLNRTPHFPTLSPENNDGSENVVERLKGRVFPAPLDGNISLSSLFSMSLLKRDHLIDSSAILQDGRMGLTFRQLDDMSRKVAKLIDSKVAMKIPVEKEAIVNADGDSVIAILTESSIIDERIIVYILAILKLGATFINLQPSKMTTSEWKQTIRQVQPLIVIASNSNMEIPEMIAKTKLTCTVNKHTKEKATLPFHVLTSDELWKAALKLKNEDNREISVTPWWSKTALSDRTAGIFKAPIIPCREPHYVRIGHKALYNRINWEKLEVPTHEQEKFYLTYPISDPRALVQIFLPLCIGKPLKFLDPNMFFDAPYLLSQIVQWAMFRLYISPKHLEKLLDHVEFTGSQKDLNPVCCWMVSGDHFDVELGAKFFRVVPPSGKLHKRQLAVFYGCAEVLWAATCAKYRNLREFTSMSNNGNVCVGVPLHNTSIHIFDDKSWSHCPLGIKGEICICGGSFAAGGYSGQGVTHKPGLVFQTGDLGRIFVDENGNKSLILEGKTWSRVKYKGIVLDLKEIGRIIEDQKIVSKCVLFLSPRTRECQAVIAAYVPLEGPEGKALFEVAEVSKKIMCIEPLIDICIPVKEIPRLKDGLIDQKALRREYHLYLTSCPVSEWTKLNFNQPEKNAAKVLCKSIAACLGKHVSYIIHYFTASFWSLGGNPVKAVRTIAAVKSQGWDLSIEDFVVSGRLDTLVERMILAKSDAKRWIKSSEDVTSKIKYEEFSQPHLNSVIRLMKKDFDAKADDQRRGIDRYWTLALDEIMRLRLSIVALKEDKVVGFCINCKVIPKITGVPIEIAQALGLFFAVIEACKTEVTSTLVGKLVKSYYIGIDDVNLTPAQRVLVIRDVISKSFEISQNAGYSSFLICSANPLVQEVCSSLLNFRPLLELPMNRYKTKNFLKPYWDKDDHEKVGVYLKTISEKNKEPEANPVAGTSKAKVKSKGSIFKVKDKA